MVSFFTVPRTASQKPICDSVFEVGARFGFRGPPRPAAAPAEKLAEQIAEIRAARAAKIESAEIEVSAAAPAPAATAPRRSASKPN